MTVTFEGYERRADKINKCLADNGIASLEEALQICTDKGFNPREIVNNTQSIAFQNAEWAYTLGCALAVKRGAKSASEAAAIIGEGIQAFTVPGSVAEDRKVGLGHGNLGAMLLSDESKCFAFLAGHESFAAAEGAIGIVRNANKARKEPLRVILNGLGKDAAQIISRINGFTYVQTKYDYLDHDVKEDHALSVVGVAWVLWRWRPAPSVQRLPPEHFFSAVRSGIRYVHAAPVLRNVLVRTVAFFVFGSAGWALLPLVARRIVGLARRRRVYRGWQKPRRFDRNLIVIGGGAGGLVSAYIAAAVKDRKSVV